MKQFQSQQCHSGPCQSANVVMSVLAIDNAKAKGITGNSKARAISHRLPFNSQVTKLPKK